MWSDTDLTLTEFALLIHIDPYRLAQVDRTGTAQAVTCECYTQNSDRRIGRDEIVRAIAFAESLFVQQAGFYPVPTAITADRQEYPKTRGEALKLFTPQYGLVQQFGVLEWTELDEVALTKVSGPNLQDVFTCTFPVPDDTTAEQLHVFINSTDSGALLPDRAWEVRPLSRVTVDNSGGAGAWTATIVAPAYLFVQPDLYLTADCLPHEVDTYVDSITVYRATVDACQQGQFVFRPNCGQPPCGEQYASACFEKQGRSKVRPYFASCDEDGVLTASSICSVPAWPPTHLEMNYIAGAPLDQGLMNAQWAEAIFGFALANMDDGLRLCECDDVAAKKYKKYRSVPKEPISTGLGGPNSRQYSLLVDKEDIRRLKGLDPVYGNLRALGILRRHTARAHAMNW